MMLEVQRVRFMLEQIIDKFFEQKTAFRNRLRVLDLQLAIILHEHRLAGGLEEEDRMLEVRAGLAF